MKNKAGKLEEALESSLLMGLVFFFLMTVITQTVPFTFKKEVLKYKLVLMRSLSTDMYIYIFKDIPTVLINIWKQYWANHMLSS